MVRMRTNDHLGNRAGGLTQGPAGHFRTIDEGSAIELIMKSAAPPAKPKGQAFRYKPKYGVIVVCKDEQDQEQKFRSLSQRGWKLKVVCV